MDRRQFALAAGAVSLAGLPAAARADDVLKGVMAGAHRLATDKARDVHRHPEESLTFFGLKPGMTIIEIVPGTGYFDILAPYAKATGGKYIATGADTNFRERLRNAALYGTPAFTGAFNLNSGPLAPAGSADLVVTFRNVHNWLWTQGLADKAFRDFAAVLKPGGVLGVVEHRADPRPETVQNGRRASDGYVARATILALAQQAGLRLDGESQVNANPKDTKDHPYGVWTLPPTNRATPPLPEGWNPEKYRQIGESDRMTLRFVKA
jgi:predicted methyltransferase